MTPNQPAHPRAALARRRFLQFLAASPLAAAASESIAASSEEACPAAKDGQAPDILAAPRDATNVLQFEEAARQVLDPDLYHFIADGADDMKTVRANRQAFDKVQIRARRLVDVSRIDTARTVLGQAMETPIILAPIGGQQQIDPEGELASARAAFTGKHVYMVSTVSSYSVGEIAAAGDGTVWFQLYANPDRAVLRQLLDRAEAAGAGVVAVTVDSPVLGNREHQNLLRRQQAGARPGRQGRLGNFEGVKGRLRIGDPALTWDFIDWLRANTAMKIVLKGIVTGEDAALCVAHGVDGLIVSNHGGRQEESNRGTLEALPEIVAAVQGRLPVLIDGGFRRGTDIFKALALGADAICIGRPYMWGLAAFGEAGVATVLALLRAELVRIMKLAGTPRLADITPNHIVSHL